jgi:hypothetical protein
MDGTNIGMVLWLWLIGAPFVLAIVDFAMTRAPRATSWDSPNVAIRSPGRV